MNYLKKVSCIANWRFFALAMLLAPSLALAATELSSFRADSQKQTEAPVVKQEIEYLSVEQLSAHKASLERVQGYLTNLTTLKADFTQTAPDGSLTTGTFYLKRPGKMRWEYAPPTPVLIVSNGSELVYFDKELEQVTYVPMASTMAGFLAEKNIRFDGPVGIEQLSEANGVIRITLSQREKPDEGKLTLELVDKPMLLRNMVIRDASNQVTHVALNNAKFGIKLDNELFVFRDPRKKQRR